MKLPEYKELQDKGDYFDNYVIETPKNFEAFYSDFAQKEGLIYRGVNEAKFQIYTSAQRFWLTDNLKSQSSFTEFIGKLLCKLKSDNTIIEYLESTDVTYNDVLGLAMLQHFGAPSTLIDFSLDLNCALFFAFDGMKRGNSYNEIDDYVSIYVVNRKSLDNSLLPNLTEMYEHGMETGTKMIEDIRAEKPNIRVDDSLIRNIDKFVCWYDPKNPQGGLSSFNTPFYIGNPLVEKSFSTFEDNQKFYWSNINLIAQKGCFILNTHESLPIEEFMASNGYKIICFNIHKTLSEYIKDKINLRYDDIYPDLHKRISSVYSEYLKMK